MASNVTTPDWFAIGLSNYTSDAYSKNSATAKIGGYASRTAYIWEVLFRPDLSGIPGGSTISAVTISFVVGATVGGPFNLRVHEQNKATWADNGSTIPRWNTAPNSDSATAWPAYLSQVSASGTGTKTIPTSANLVTWFQSKIGTTNNGLILTWYTEYFGWYLTGGTVTVTITYEAGGAASTYYIIS